MRYKRDGAWHDVTYARARRDRPGGRPRADRPRPAGRRAHLHPRQHAPRVDLRRHGRHLRRRGRRADLPDQLARGVPLGDLRLRTPARSSARTRSSSPRSLEIRDQIPNLRTVIVMDPPTGALPRPAARGDHARAGARARPRPLRRGARRAPRRRAPRGPLHVHLHLRHDRPAEGLRAHARQLQRDRST